MPDLLVAPRIDGDSTRRQFLIGGASLTTLLAGCSTDALAPGPPAASTGFPVATTTVVPR